MKNTVKVLAFFLLVVTLIGTVPFASFGDNGVNTASESVGTEGLEYLESDGEVYVGGYSGTEAVVTVPAEYNGLPVVGIEQGAFSGNNDVTAVIIESEHIEYLCNGEFEGCYSLEYIVLPSSVTDINGITFWAGNVIPEIRYMGSEGELSYDSIEVGKVVFDYSFHTHEYRVVTVEPTCTEKGTVTHICDGCGDSYISKRMAALGHSYDGNDDLECNRCGEVRVPEKLIAEGSAGASVNWKLRDDGTLVIYGEGSMLYLEDEAGQPWAAYKSQITRLVIEEGVVSIGRNNFYGYSGITEVVLPESLMSIEEFAFYGCRGITEIKIPARVFYIGEYAFRRVSGITLDNPEGWAFSNGVVIDSAEATELFANNFTKLCLRTYEQTAGEIIYSGTYKTFTWTVSNTGVLTIGGEGDMPRFGVSNAPWYAFRGAIRHIVIEDNVTSIGRCAFYGYKTVVGLEINAPVAKIGEYAFYKSPLLESVNIPASVVQIDPYAFRRTGLKVATFEIPYGWSADGVKIETSSLVGEGAADSLKLAYFTKTMVRDVNAEPEEVDPNYITYGMMNSSTRWTLYWTDETKTAVKVVISGKGKMADFGTGEAPWYEEYKDKVVEVVVEEGITNVGRCAFYGLSNLSKVTLHEGLEIIDAYAFSRCSALTEITIPTTVTSIGTNAFYRTGLAEIPTV